MEPRYRDETWLRERYWGDGMTQREIAEECDVSARTIGKYMSKFGIETRDIEGQNHPMYGTQRTEEVKEKTLQRYRGASSRTNGVRRSLKLTGDEHSPRRCETGSRRRWPVERCPKRPVGE